MTYLIFHITFLLTILQQFDPIRTDFQDNGSLEGARDVHLFTEDLQNVHMEFSISKPKVEALDDPLTSNLKLFLRFEPEILDFKQRTLGVPYYEKVTVINTNKNKTIVMSSISGSTVHFHSSFFEDKVIPPNGNTTFNVVFLGRQEGVIESVLLIHTSEGSVKYKVQGTSVTNPYRLRPLVDIRLPLNASFSPLIYLHNPHETAIQITEVYSSGGEFHLELPTGELEGPKQMWEIPPFQTRPVIRVRFNARTEANHTAYIRIKLNKSEEVLIVPVEVKVGSFPGLFATQGGVDFGTGGSLDTPKRVQLLLHNTWKKAIRIHSIVTEPNNGVVNVSFEPVKIAPFKKSPTLAAYLTINWKEAFNLKQFYGKVIVKCKQLPYDMVIPYWSTIFAGGFSYNASVAQYLSEESSLDVSSRKFPFTNYFNAAVAIVNVTLPEEAQSYFSILNFEPIVIPSNKTVSLFTLKFARANAGLDFHFQSNILIFTNISTVKVPLLSYDGKLKMIIPFGNPNEEVLDVGLVGHDQVKETYIVLTNNNPVEVHIKKWSNNLKITKLSLVGCDSGNFTTATINYEFSNLKPCDSLKPNEYAVFMLSIKIPHGEGLIWGDLKIETNYELILIPVTLRTAQGKFSVEPERIVFDNCFPNKICSQKLQVHSTFGRGMYFVKINSLPYDERFWYDFPNKTTDESSSYISPRISRVIANLYFDTSVKCAPHCYTGFILNSTVGTQWLSTLTLLYSTLEFDLKLLNTMYGGYLNVTAKGLSRWQNLKLRLDTSEVKEFIFNTRIKMTWPKILTNSSSENKSFLMFPTTQIGNISSQTLTFHNPSSNPIILHLVMEAAYPGGRKLYEHLPNGFKRIYPNTSGVLASTFYFGEQNPTSEKMSELNQTYNLTKHVDTMILVLDPGKSADVNIYFNATSSLLKSTLLYIRNNLTAIEVVRLVGQGAHSLLKFGSRKPGSLLPLTFEFNDKVLKECEKERRPAKLFMKRVFQAKNVGDVTIYVKGFYINGYSCEGYGYKVINCEPFNLLPNETRKIEIVFTPDFTLARIQRTLILDTSLSINANFTLVATVPSYYLGLCSKLIDRPVWENILYKYSLGFMCCMLLCILIGAFLESDRIIRTTVQILTRDVMQAPLDLRLIGAKATKVEEEKVEEVSKRPKEVLVKSWTDISKKKYANNVSPTPVCNNIIKNGKKKVVKKNSTENVEVEKKLVFVEKPVVAAIRNKRSSSPVNRKPKPDESPIIKKVSPVAIIETVQTNVVPIKKPLTKKKSTKDLACSEEDTSSTTTEYSNNEDGDKENVSTGIKPDKNRLVTKKLKVKNDFRDNYEGDDEDNENKTVSHTHHHQWKIRSDVKLPKTNGEITDLNIKLDPISQSNPKRNNRTSNREKKEKLPVKKQRSTDKHNGKLPESKFMSTPPIPPSNCWGETRARFSDVVAGSDSSSLLKDSKLNSSNSFFEMNLPEPESHNNAQLGPIGSKKSPVNIWESIPNVSNSVGNGLVDGLPQMSNESLFMNNFMEATQPLVQSMDNPVMDTTTLMNQLAGYGSELWETQASAAVLNMLQNSAMSMLGDYTHTNAYYPNNNSWATGSNSFWGDSGFLPPPVGEERQQLHQQQTHAGLSSGVSPFWNASPWTPPSTISPGTPTRTPPGFPARPPVREEDPEQTYDPFRSLSDIWNPPRAPPS